MPHTPSVRRYDFAVILATLLLTALTWSTPQGMYSDPAWQLKALQQWERGETASLNHLAVDTSDRSRRSGEWLSWWPPSTTVLVWPLREAGFSFGGAVRTISLLAILIGSLGWIRWWRAFDLPGAWLMTVALLLPWLHYASATLFEYSAEALTFATVPWALLAAWRLLSALDRDNDARPGVGRALLTGLALGALYFVKYSAVFIAAGALLAIGLHQWRRASRRWRVIVALAAGVAIPVVVLSVISRLAGGATNMLTASFAWHFSPRLLLHLAGNPGLMAADADSMLQYVFTNPSHGLWRDPAVVAAMGVPGGLTLLWVCRRPQSAAERLALVCLTTSLLLMLAAWTFSSGVSLEARHISGAAMAALPAAVAAARKRWSSYAPTTRGWLVAVALTYTVVPAALYSPVAAIVKARRPGVYPVGPAHVFNLLLSDTDAQAAVQNLRMACDQPAAVWYIPDPLASLEFEGPMVIADAEFERPDELQARRYPDAAPVCALLSPTFEASGKGVAIRDSFAGVRRWTRQAVPASRYDLWIGTVQ